MSQRQRPPPEGGGGASRSGPDVPSTGRGKHTHAAAAAATNAPPGSAETRRERGGERERRSPLNPRGPAPTRNGERG